MLWATIDGKKSPPAFIRSCNDAVHLTFPISVPRDHLEGEVKLELDRTIRVPSDTRDLGIAIRTIESVDRTQ
jgi:hypothetical protein